MAKTTDKGAKSAEIKTAQTAPMDHADEAPASLATRPAEENLNALSYEELANRSATLNEPVKIDNKADLIGVPFVITECTFKEGDNGFYCNIVARVKPQRPGDNDQVLFTDGSKGIYETMRAYLDAGMKLPLRCDGGLRVSKYTVEIEGKQQKAETYYLTAGRIASDVLPPRRPSAG